MCGSLANTNKVQLLQCNIDPLLSKDNDETFTKLYKKKAPKEGREKEARGKAPKSRQAKSPKEVSNKEQMEPLRTKPSTNPMKHIN